MDTEDFSRDVVQGTVDAINAGSMGPNVTAWNARARLEDSNVAV